ncbi:ketosteroid isomerase [Cellvibrio zantedeschiae]|uniref:Ketosteroid isomerase n=1 Tax=Cellvibrio zantedeschiae TaxID=1237077 RepID=A0ABQ3BD10_9GAMM|nr:nuclear transport factor 2 family protein [Cellvibrio zantedeschiae]GGY84584.1 ketosteroid isomerase [Cellvibrio zantedeschiae]
MSTTHVQLIHRLYEYFNSRNIEGVLAALTEDVCWANAMDGGHVQGHEGVREYWSRQWAMVSPHVEPLAFEETQETVTVTVVQSVFDLNGQPLSGQTHGLKDKTVLHIFHIEKGRIKRFDVKD